MTTVDATISAEDGDFYLRLGGGLVGQGSQAFSWVRREVEAGEADGDVGPSWASGRIRGDALLRFIEGIGDVEGSPLDGIKAVTEADLRSAIQPTGWYLVSCVEV
ncbi:MAG: hypothetical protein QOE64_1874 [Frankiales bacterium]|jgi:hypothetical protein|nr:hypothetical protein [Frankiales bacterium]